MPRFAVTILLLANLPLRAQDLPAFPDPLAVARAGQYGSIKLQDLPRDENGNLKPEVWDIVAAEAERSPNTNEARALTMRPGSQEFYKRYLGWKAPAPRVPASGKLANLPDTPTEPRFPLTGKVWPEKPGEASVCLWDDDKLAAMSISIDDNCAPDIPYWKELAKKHNGLHLTWNIITANIDGVMDKPRGPMSGKWETWRQLRAEGYHLASHSTTHLINPVLADGWPGPDWETSESLRQIDENVPGQKTKIFVYPGAGVRVFSILGGYYPNSTWRPSVVKYYAAARGGGGNPLNEANKIDYFNIHSTTAILNILDSNDPKSAEFDLRNLFAGDPAHPYHKYYRGWASVFIHYINGGQTWDTNPYTIAFDKILAFYDQHRDDLWTGFLDDVALYGQERDTATLVTDKATEKEIAFTLTSKMDPEVFDYPLTVKVRLFDSWKNLAATQNGAAVPARVVVHEGKPYALVKALPDRGPVTLAPKPAE